jgi:hypothetical protein
MDDLSVKAASRSEARELPSFISTCGFDRQIVHACIPRLGKPAAHRSPEPAGAFPADRRRKRRERINTFPQDEQAESEDKEDDEEEVDGALSDDVVIPVSPEKVADNTGLADTALEPPKIANTLVTEVAASDALANDPVEVEFVHCTGLGSQLPLPHSST